MSILTAFGIALAMSLAFSALLALGIWAESVEDKHPWSTLAYGLFIMVLMVTIMVYAVGNAGG